MVAVDNMVERIMVYPREKLEKLKGISKVVNSEDYIPFFGDSAYIIYEMDW